MVLVSVDGAVFQIQRSPQPLVSALVTGILGSYSGGNAQGCVVNPSRPQTKPRLKVNFRHTDGHAR